MAQVLPPAPGLVKRQWGGVRVWEEFSRADEAGELFEGFAVAEDGFVGGKPENV